MRWEDERYVRAYTNDEGDYVVWSWQARALWWPLLRRCNRVGVVRMGRHRAKALAVMVRLPVEVVEVGLDGEDGLIADGCVKEPQPGVLFIPNYMAAQEAKQGDAARKRAERERERDRLEAIADGVLTDKSVTKTDTESQDRTGSHDSSQPVTLSRAEPSTDREKDLAASAKPKPQQAGVHDDEPFDLAAPKRQAYLDAIATASSGRFIGSKPTKGGTFKLDAARKRPSALDEAKRIGQWLAAGGDWRAAKGQRLDGRNIGSDLDAWIAQSEAWDRQGRQPVNAQPARNGAKGRPRLIPPAEPCSTEGVPAEGRDATLPEGF
jgi:hypothetical protein